jgi:iron complex transport system substrate-binding protein
MTFRFRKLHLYALTSFLLLLTSGMVYAQSTTECQAGFRLFTHKLLASDPVCIPENPQRIVSLENAATELLLFTDKEIVGTFQVFTKDELSASLPALESKLQAITGFDWPVNLETLLATSPDLIATYENETMPYDQLSQIAPTVIFKAGIAEGDWKTATEFWSEVFNVQDVYQKMLATYEARVNELKAAIGDKAATTKVSLVLASSYFNMIYTEDAPTGYILQDAGLARPESQALNSEESTAKYGNTTFAYLSDETLNLADGDIIFLFTFPAYGADAQKASEEYLTQFQANPLWKSLKAVSNGDAYAVGAAWTRGNTYLLANAVLDDLFKYVAKTEPTIPNPITTFGQAEATPEATASS